MIRIMRTITAMICLVFLCIMALYVFGSGSMRMDRSLTSIAYAGNISNDFLPQEAEPGEESPGAETQQEAEQYLLPYPQAPSMFSDMDMQYAYLILQQGLEKSFLKDHAELSLENGNEFVIRCSSEGIGLEITEGLADNETRLAAWDNAVNTLWELDAILSRDIKETLGTDKSVTIQIVDDFHPHNVLLKIRDGQITFNLFRDGTSPKYEVYGR